jgi:hypothetical protein
MYINSTLNHNRKPLLCIYIHLAKKKKTVYICYTKHVQLDCVPGSCDLTVMILCSCMVGNTTGCL